MPTLYLCRKTLPCYLIYITLFLLGNLTLSQFTLSTLSLPHQPNLPYNYFISYLISVYLFCIIFPTLSCPLGNLTLSRSTFSTSSYLYSNIVLIVASNY